MTLLRTLFDLTGRVAVVTGGSRGLGLQIAEALAEFGATVVLAARKPAELEAAAAHLASFGRPVDTVVADLGRPDAAEALAHEVIARHGGVDILINNAGATWGAPAEDHPLAGWTKVMDLNVTGLFLLTQAVAKRSFLPRGRGVIVNVASIEGLQGRAGMIAYSTAKGAVVNMTRALAAEWGPLNIRVNALAPGYFPSKMTATTLERSGAELTAATPLRKLGGDDDLKGAALLLASDAGAHITGQILVVDGGMTVV